MKTIKYKGYQGVVEYEDGTLFIKVLHIDDLLIAQCDSAAEVETAFANLVDEYLEDCKELGREPTKPFKGSFNVRMGPEMHRLAAMAAADHSQTLNAWVVEAVSEKLDCDRLTQRVDKVLRTTKADFDAVRKLAAKLDPMHTPTSVETVRLQSFFEQRAFSSRFQRTYWEH